MENLKTNKKNESNNYCGGDDKYEEIEGNYR